jgi:hypothetical protein
LDQKLHVFVEARLLSTLRQPQSLFITVKDCRSGGRVLTLMTEKVENLIWKRLEQGKSQTE